MKIKAKGWDFSSKGTREGEKEGGKGPWKRCFKWGREDLLRDFWESFSQSCIFVFHFSSLERWVHWVTNSAALCYKQTLGNSFMSPSGSLQCKTIYFPTSGDEVYKSTLLGGAKELHRLSCNTWQEHIQSCSCCNLGRKEIYLSVISSENSDEIEAQSRCREWWQSFSPLMCQTCCICREKLSMCHGYGKTYF